METGLLRLPNEVEGMALGKISGHGLAAIALSVSLLWACWIATQVTIHRATVTRARVLRDIHRMQQRRQPAPASLPFQIVRPLANVAG
jgi:hypothetical protein